LFVTLGEEAWQSKFFFTRTTYFGFIIPFPFSFLFHFFLFIFSFFYLVKLESGRSQYHESCTNKQSSVILYIHGMLDPSASLFQIFCAKQMQRNSL
jgi:hypothetical protein